MIREERLTELKTAFRQFIWETCSELSNITVPTKRWVRIVREESSTRFPEELRPDYFMISLMLIDAFDKKMPDSLRQTIEIIRSVPELSTTILADAAGKPITDEKMQYYWATNTLSGTLINKYFVQAGGIRFDEQVFEKVFDRFRNDITSSMAKITEISPLINLTLDCDTIEISPNIVLRKIEISELEAWLNEFLRFPLFSFYKPGDVIGLNCALEVTHEVARHGPWTPDADIHNSVINLLTTLRLITDQNVHMAFTKTITPSFLFPGGMSMSSPLRSQSDRNAGIVLGIRHKENIIDTWKSICSLAREKRINLALRRWDILSQRFDEDDTLIDYWIALESLFAPDSSQEVTYRASLRIAAFIGENPEQRQQIFQNLKKSYKLRSSIVHGEPLKDKEKKEKSEIIKSTRSYLRTALIKIMSSVGTFKPTETETNLLGK